MHEEIKQADKWPLNVGVTRGEERDHELRGSESATSHAEILSINSKDCEPKVRLHNEAARLRTVHGKKKKKTFPKCRRHVGYVVRTTVPNLGVRTL